MELINTTSIPVSTAIANKNNDKARFVMITAKACFNFTDDGVVTLEKNEPFPIFDNDVETDLGILPRDDMPKLDSSFEVILLGAAYAPQNTQVTSTTVKLAINDIEKELLVYGNRVWQGENESATISTPEPFQRIPLTYQNAFGGMVEVLIDKDSPIDISDPRNPAGKGFNASESAEGLSNYLKPPKGYPSFDKTRYLPNIEKQGFLIQHWTDAPDPICWSTMSLSSPLHVQRAIDVDLNSTVNTTPNFHHGLYQRAHPDWIISHPPQNSLIKMYNLHPKQENLQFNLPSLQIIADYNFGELIGSLELVPRLLMLLPEENKFYITFRSVLDFTYDAQEHRSIRIQTRQGWYNSQSGEQV